MNFLKQILNLLFRKKVPTINIDEKLTSISYDIQKSETNETMSSFSQSIQEIQIKLAGFSGTVFDGITGPGTEKQIKQFQTDYMKVSPTGIVSDDLLKAIDKFAIQFPLDFNQLKCPCGKCSGFGRGLYKDVYIQGKPKLEMYYMYEYPGIHKAILWAVRALVFYNPEYKFIFTAGYRCSVNNIQNKRTSTNHCGKAVDMDTLNVKNIDDDKTRCNKVRGIAIMKSNAQMGWNNSNQKSLEPPDIAPTWIHYDARSYDKKYLDDKFFCKNIEQLNRSIV